MAAKRSGIEVKSIDYVGRAERHGRVADQGPFWFLGNFHFFTIAIGFVGPAIGLSFGFTALAGTLGILFGTVFMAFHASQGAALGLPQMIQSRAQFGYRGVTLVLLGTLVTFVGFNVVDSVLVASGLKRIVGWNPLAVTLILAAIAAALAIFGHDWLHRIFKWCFIACLPLYLVLTAAILCGFVRAEELLPGRFSWVGLIAQFAASASYNITYAPYVSDYSRYLAHDTPSRSIIGAVFVGAASSAIWLIVLGAWLATRLGAADGLAALDAAGNELFEGFGLAISLASVSALVATMGLNAYSGMLTLLTALDSFTPVRSSQRLRVAAILLLALIWVALALVSGGNSIGLLYAALTIMLYLLVPWTAVNLIDYFLIRRGRYAITDLMRPNGVYGQWGVRGLGAYLIGFAAALPFLVLPDLYVGPAARRLGGVDLGWLVGLLTSGACYALFCRALNPAAEEAAIRRSESELG